MARKPRVVIPENPGLLIKLTAAVYAKHQADGTKSPLLLLDSPTWDELGPDVVKVAATQARIEVLEKELKELYGDRDPHLEVFTEQDRRSRDVLLAKYAANPAMLGGHGFDVIEAVAPAAGAKKAAR